MLPKHDFESAFSDDAATMKGLFWNPVEVAEVAWRELLNKLSAVAAVEAAAEAVAEAVDLDAEAVDMDGAKRRKT